MGVYTLKRGDLPDSFYGSVIGNLNSLNLCLGLISNLVTLALLEMHQETIHKFGYTTIYLSGLLILLWN